MADKMDRQPLASAAHPVTGHLASVEFVRADDVQLRKPGTYITIRVDDDTQWTAGGLLIEYDAHASAQAKFNE